MFVSTNILSRYICRMEQATPDLQQELETQPFELPEQEAYLNLVHTHSVLESEFARLFKQHGLSQPLYNVLKVVIRAGSQGVPSQSIAQYMLANDPDITRLVDRLEKIGLVTRERGTQDRRLVWVKITDDGCRQIEALEALVKALHKRQLSHMSAAKLAQLNQLLVEARHPPMP